MPDVLLCTERFWSEFGTRVTALAPTIDGVRLTGGAQLEQAELDRVTIAFWSPDTYPDGVRPFLGAARRAPNLRWFQSFFAGTDNPVFGELRGKGTIVTSAAGSNAAPIAQMVMAYLLSFACDLPRLHLDQAQRRWDPGAVTELAGMRLVIVGLGSIGQQVARLGGAFGMDVIGLRRRPQGDEPCETWTDDRLHEALASADAVVVCAPLTDRTRGMIGNEQFARMRRGAWFVNVGRGEIVDEPAMVAALRSGQIGRAGLDVFAFEPLPDDSELWSMPNVIVTPHMSGTSDPSDLRAVELFFDNLARWVAGEQLRNVSRQELTR